MNKQKIKNWVKKNKYKIAGGIALFATYKYGVRIGQKKQIKICNKGRAALGDYTFIDRSGEYLVKDLGKLGVDSLAAPGCPKTFTENTKIKTIMYFYDV